MASELLIHEDERVLVVNKPNNLLVHHSHYARNIRELSLVQRLRELIDSDIYPVHRLDRKTSGVIVFAKTKEAAKHLQDQFEAQTTSKKYLALVRGWTEDKGSIDSPIKNEDSGKYRDALTAFKTIEKVECNFPVAPYPTSRYSIVQLSPKTGRMHQLRKHMNKIAHPIIGDPKYGNRHHNHKFEELFGHSKLYLHAQELRFEHPRGEVVSFKAELPAHWKQNLSYLGFHILER